jgi:hypothetical protein
MEEAKNQPECNLSVGLKICFWQKWDGSGRSVGVAAPVRDSSAQQLRPWPILIGCKQISAIGAAGALGKTFQRHDSEDASRRRATPLTGIQCQPAI